MRYHDFDLSIERGADGTIRLRSWCDAHGEYRDAAIFDASELALDQQLLAVDEVARAKLVALGSRLYTYTFASKGRNIEWHFGQCWGAAGSSMNGVRVRLRVEEPDLAVIPWEYLYSQRLNSFLGVSERTPIVRYLELPQAIPSLEAELPVRVLIAIPRQPELDTATELKEILAALEPLKDAVEVTVLEGEVSRRRISDELATNEYHVFHFIGHGDFVDDRAVLLLYDNDGNEELVDQHRMAGLFRNHPSLKLVVLNSCRGGELSASKPLVGMGAELVRLGIPAVIAMQYEIVDDEAVTFARTLYRHLFTSKDRGRIEIAVSHARNALAEEYPDTRAVGLPVLFMHAREGVLFSLESGNPLRELSARSADRMKAVVRTHERNLEVMREQTAERRVAVVAEGSDSFVEEVTRPARSADEGSVDEGWDEGASREAESRERRSLRRMTQRLRFRHLTIILAIAVALPMVLAASFFGFQTIHPVFRPESYVVAFTDLFHHHEAQESALIVAIDSSTTEALGGAPEASWRGRHAVVLDNLVAAGARVVVFNLAFTPAPEEVGAQTDSLARALAAASQSGTRVLAATNAFEGDAPRVDPRLPGFAGLWPNCVDTAEVTAPVMTLASGSGRAASAAGDGANAGNVARGRVLSLPLAAVAALRASNDAPLDPTQDPAVWSLARSVTLDSVVAGRRDAKCAFLPGDTLFRMALDYAPRHEHQQSSGRMSYLQVLRGAPLPDLQGHLVLVGYENPRVTFPILRGWNHEQRFGLEVEADAINTVLRGIRIAPLSHSIQFGVILLMAALGALAAYLAVPFGRKGAAVALLLGVVLYFVMGAVMYAEHHALLNTLFDLSALLLAFIAVTVSRRIWFPWR